MDVGNSVFSTVFQYIRSIVRGSISLLGAFRATVPYLIGVGEHSRVVTEQYPDPVSSRTVDDLPPRTRGILINEIHKCTGCEDCGRICPVNCIDIVTEESAHPEKLWVAVFDIDFGRCMFCGLCVTVCRPQSLTHSKQFEGAVYDVHDLIRSFGRGQISPALRTKWEKMREAGVEEFD